jgi:hypothetical protein
MFVISQILTPYVTLMAQHDSQIQLGASNPPNTVFAFYMAS